MTSRAGERAHPPLPGAVGLLPQSGPDARGLRRGHPDRLPVHRGQLRPVRGGGGPMTWALRGLRNGVLTTRWPARPDDYATAMRGPATVLAPLADPDGELAALCPAGAITAGPGGLVRLDQGGCVQCGRCVAARPDAFGWQPARPARRCTARAWSCRRWRRPRMAWPRCGTSCAPGPVRCAGRCTCGTSTPGRTAPRNGRSSPCSTRSTTSTGWGSSSPPARGTPTCCWSPGPGRAA